MSRRTLKARASVDPDLTVTVAVLGPVFGYPHLDVFDGPSFADQGPEVGYAERLKVEVAADRTSRLGEIIGAAADAVGISIRGECLPDRLTGVVFYQPADDLEFQHRAEPWPRTIRLADAEGAPSWYALWSAVTVGELLHASDSGLVEGDPLRPYLWPVVPQSELVQTAIESLPFLWAAWSQFLTVKETGSFGAEIWKRIRPARELSELEPFGGWATERPQDIFPFLDGTPRSTEEIAAFFCWTEERTAGWLEGTGYALGEDGNWRPGADRAALVLHESVRSIEQLGRAPTELEIQSRFEQMNGTPEVHE